VLARQRQAARKKIDAFPEKTAPEKMTAEVKEIRSDCDLIAGKLKELDSCLAELPAELKKGPAREALTEAAAALRQELFADAYERLEPFLGQAKQWERQKKDGKTPDLDAEQLLALAVTGWLQGPASAEAKPEAALRLWRARKLALDYQRGETLAQRREVLEAYLKEASSDAVAPADLAQLIPHLPPPEAPDRTDSEPTEVTVGGRGGVSYQLQLPPEYRHGRPYPVVIVLHAAGDKPIEMLRRWAPTAAEQGYILAAPEWEQPGARGAYTFSVKEHQSVLDTLRDLRRKYQVDSDRVFLFGLREGGLMAFDVGLSHPDLFAGVMPMSAGPDLYVERYFHNGQYLPFYVVQGDRTGEPNTRLRKFFEKWVTRGNAGYPSMWVQYKGRAAEWFGGELPNLFDWMRDKRRFFPLRQLAADDDRTTLGNVFTSLRATDNRFYWLSSDQIDDACTVSPERFNARTPPATFFGRIDPANNEITLSFSGVKQLTLWLGRSPKGENMIDFDKPLLVRGNFKILWSNRRVTPSLETLLEDLYQRADRQRLFLARLDFNFK
jgi:pimeloyl-ACP methyl ester carboxylesterase